MVKKLSESPITAICTALLSFTKNVANRESNPSWVSRPIWLTIIEPNVVFGASVTVENGANIRAFSHLEGCHVSRGATVGPYARLRPGTELAEFTRVGNFVEIKNAVIDEGAKVNHLSYVGDAHVGGCDDLIALDGRGGLLPLLAAA